MAPTYNDPPAVFSPSNEPYLGRSSLQVFDELISTALNLNRYVAPATHSGALNDLQRALCQLVPAGISISLSIRELIRQGYFYGALVLLRPLAERTVSALYLQKVPSAIEIWHSGWAYGKRPGFAKMVKELWADAYPEAAKTIVTSLNSLVHGDPQSSSWNLITGDSGMPAYAVSKILDRPDICDRVASEAVTYLSELMVVMTEEFISTG